MAIVSGILLLLSIILFFIWRSQRSRLASLRAARLSTVAELKQIADAVAQEIGAGSWQDYVKIRGQVQCAQPLLSQIKQAECVYYRTKVIREYEEITSRRDESGNTIQGTQRKSETIASNTQSTPFQLLDSTGQIAIEPSGAEVETVRILSEFQSDRMQLEGRLSYGGFFLTLPNPSMGRTLGYRYEESILPMDREVLVVGMASDTTKELTIRKPSDPTQRFIISLKIEEELAQAAVRGAKLALYGMIVCLTIGTMLIVISLT
jgi:hypothetical protein